MTALTIRDLLDGKGKTCRTFVQVTTAEEARAAATAGVDMIGTAYIEGRKALPRDVPQTHFQFGLPWGTHVNADQALRTAFDAIADGATSIYCALSPKIIETLAREGIPVIGHTGLVPPTATWTGGFRAVGKSPEQARAILQKVRDLENAGAYAVELEVIPHQLATEISRRSSLFTISLGAGKGCDAQYLFSADILGLAPRIPRHARVYHDFKKEFEDLQNKRVAAYAAWCADVRSGQFPAAGQLIEMPDRVLEEVLETIETIGT